MEKSNSLMKSSLYYGVIMGAAMIVLSIILYIVGVGFEQWTSWLTYALMLGVLVWSTMQYKNSLGSEGLSYGKALGFGVMVALFAAIINAIYSYLFFTIIAPDGIQILKTMAEEQLLQRGMPDEQIEMAMQMQGKFMTPGAISLMSIPSLVVIGFIISLITSIFLKKDGDVFADDEANI